MKKTCINLVLFVKKFALVNMKIQYYILLGFTILLNSCFQGSSLQTARTLPKGNTNLGAATDVLITPDIEGGGIIPIPTLEVFARRGIAQNFDAGLKLSSYGSIGINGKYQFYGDQTTERASAVGAGVEFWYDGWRYVTSRQTIALYLSFHKNENFVWYATPKVIHQLEFGIGNRVGHFSGGDLFIGGNIGLQKRIHPRFTIIGEASVFYTFDELVFFRSGIGFTFNLNKK